MMRLIGIYGASGFGREVLPLVRQAPEAEAARIVFIDDSMAGSVQNGVEVLSWQAFLASPASQRDVTLAIANSEVRANLANLCQEAGVGFFEVKAANAVVFDAVEIGEGAILAPFTTLTSNIEIGRQFHCNIYAYVAHDCVIGDYVTFAPRVMCNGNVHIEDHAYIGTGAIIKQGRPGKPLVIGKGAVVGMGAVVTKDVPPGVTVVGNPARPLVKS